MTINFSHIPFPIADIFFIYDGAGYEALFHYYVKGFNTTVEKGISTTTVTQTFGDWTMNNATLGDNSTPAGYSGGVNASFPDLTLLTIQVPGDRNQYQVSSRTVWSLAKLSEILFTGDYTTDLPGD